ncbi:hypothetical protein E5D57_000702 [Metarhizium anisopliae]|nr:hypothetical protein E5D57_000702 [Metarhizium anisopliae]
MPRGKSLSNRRLGGFSTVTLSVLLQVALKDRGIDKLLDDAREDNKENDTRLLTPKSKISCMWLNNETSHIERRDD